MLKQINEHLDRHLHRSPVIPAGHGVAVYRKWQSGTRYKLERWLGDVPDMLLTIDEKGCALKIIPKVGDGGWLSSVVQWPVPNGPSTDFLSHLEPSVKHENLWKFWIKNRSCRVSYVGYLYLSASLDTAWIFSQCADGTTKVSDWDTMDEFGLGIEVVQLLRPLPGVPIPDFLFDKKS